MRGVPLTSALLLMFAVWAVLASGSILSPLIGQERATLLVFCLAAALVLATRPPSPVRLRPRDAARFGVAIAVGFAVHPFLCAGIALVGLALGLDPSTATPSGAGGLPLLIAVVVVAPVFEELLYRERLLDAFAATSLGRGGAALLSSALFAVTHLTPWQVLGTFLVGMLLALTRRFSRKISACIGIHAGLNLRWLWDCAGGTARG
jgi:membrane protease YdiL (CAAX protease family)